MSDLIQRNLTIIGDTLQGTDVDELISKMVGNCSDKAKGITQAMCRGLLSINYSKRAIDRILELAVNDLNQSVYRIEALAQVNR